MQNNILQLWSALKAYERKTLLIAVTTILIIIGLSYILNISESISIKKRALTIAKSNFTYVHDKAKNFEQFLSAQQALRDFSSVPEFILAKSKGIEILDFQLGEEGDRTFISFKAKSALNYSEFLESLSLHPAISLETFEAVFEDNLQITKVYLASN